MEVHDVDIEEVEDDCRTLPVSLHFSRRLVDPIPSALKCGTGFRSSIQS